MEKLSTKDLEIVKELIEEKIEDIKQEIEILDGSCNSPFINDGLVNEVRIAKEHFIKKIECYEEIVKKLF